VFSPPWAKSTKPTLFLDYSMFVPQSVASHKKNHKYFEKKSKYLWIIFLPRPQKIFLWSGYPPIKSSHFMGGKSFFSGSKNDLGGDALTRWRAETFKRVHLTCISSTERRRTLRRLSYVKTVVVERTAECDDPDCCRKEERRESAPRIHFISFFFYVVWGSVGVPWLGWGWGADARSPSPRGARVK